MIVISQYNGVHEPPLRQAGAIRERRLLLPHWYSRFHYHHYFYLCYHCCYCYYYYYTTSGTAAAATNTLLPTSLTHSLTHSLPHSQGAFQTSANDQCSVVQINRSPESPSHLCQVVSEVRLRQPGHSDQGLDTDTGALIRTPAQASAFIESMRPRVWRVRECYSDCDYSLCDRNTHTHTHSLTHSLSHSHSHR